MKTRQELSTTAGQPAASLWALEPGLHHLNHGSFGGVPAKVIEQQRELQDQMDANPVRWFCELPERIEDARIRVARQLGVDPDTAAFVPNASGGASIVYQALDHRGPVDVVVTSHGYGAVVMGAERLAVRTGGTCTSVEIPLAATAEEVVSLVEAHLAAHPCDLLVIDQITSATARAFPTTALCEIAHRRGALVLVDGAHAPGVHADPVERAADVWVGNLHKFWCAPRGCAVLVRNNPELDLHPLIDSWSAPDPFPQRLNYQGTLDATSWLAAPTAWQHLEEQLGWEQVRRHSVDVLDEGCGLVADALRAVGVEDPLPDVGQPVGPLRLIRLPGDRGWTHSEVDALRVPFMERSGFIVSFTNVGRQGFMRLSAHAYTTLEDLRALADTGIPILADWIGSQLQERKDQ